MTQRTDDAIATIRFEVASLQADLRDARVMIRLMMSFGCPVCGGDCASANPPVACCPMNEARSTLAKLDAKP